MRVQTSLLLVLASLLLLTSPPLTTASPQTRPAKPSGTWYPFQLGTDEATAYYNKYSLKGGVIQTLRTPYPQGCFWACLDSMFNTSGLAYKPGCASWSYEVKTKACSLLKSYGYTYKNKTCSTWIKNTGYISGFVYFGEEDLSSYTPCK